MALFDKWRRSGGSRGADVEYLRQWVAGHHGVEAFVEPKTTVTEVTVVLVAADGEWTRRRTGGDAGARKLSKQLDIPVYDVQKVGYPQRMRDYDARRRIERQRALRSELEE
ncbi:MAG: oxidoreductase [Mycolicibacterium cosmeticum]|nr:oxidoreductase [Mycolicibacterium cosmeticum]